jgi:hypothetical protein
MRLTTGLVALGAALTIVAGQGAMAQAPAQNSQQAKMTTCNESATAKSLKGSDREAFMKTCLSKNGGAQAHEPAKGNSQQQKMTTCNEGATAKGLKGDERKAFMQKCLSKDTR